MTKTALKTAIARIDEIIPELSKHGFEEVLKRIHEHQKKKFHKRNQKPKYGHLSKYIPENKWKILYGCFSTNKEKFIFWLMKKLALRIGEVSVLNLKNVSLQDRTIFIISEKSHMPDILYLDHITTERLSTWISSNTHEIQAHSGFLFFPDKNSGSKRLFMSQDCLRNKFREACTRAKIQIEYGSSDNTGRILNLYTTHSLRHTAITDFYCKTKDLVLTQRFARHQDIQQTLHYIHRTEEEMRAAIDSSISDVQLSPEDNLVFRQMLDDFKNARRLMKSDDYLKNILLSSTAANSTIIPNRVLAMPR